MAPARWPAKVANRCGCLGEYGSCAPLSAGADVNARDTQGWTALHHAVGYGDQPGIHHPMARQPVRGLVEALLKANAPINAVDKYRRTPVMVAVNAGHEDAARWLVDAGAGLTQRDQFGGTALTRAVWYEHCTPGFIQFLRQKGSPINLWDALWLGETVQALRLAEQTNVDMVGPNGFMYLHLAALMGNTKVAVRLIARKAKVNIRADKGWSALHLACGGTPQEVIPSGQIIWKPYGATTGRKELVQLLLKAGASRKANDSSSRGRTPKDWAIGLKRKELIPLLG